MNGAGPKLKFTQLQYPRSHIKILFFPRKKNNFFKIQGDIWKQLFILVSPEVKSTRTINVEL